MRVSSKSVVLVSIFAALHAALYLSSFELWRSWSIYLEPIEGIILGPWVGFASALVGSMVARAVKPSELWLFGIIAEPVGVMVCGFIAKKQWKPPLAIYAFMLGAYFVHPFGRWLPLWTVLDIIAALVLIYPVTEMCGSIFKEDNRLLPFMIPLVAFIGTVTDALTRVFLLIPVGLYAVFGWPAQTVYYIFVLGATDSYIEDILIIAVSFIIGAPLVVALRRILGMEQPLS
jgi:hypothetical protein